MPLKKVSLILLLLIHWGLSSGQTSTDSVKFSVDEARKIAIKLSELKECAELLSVTEQQVTVLDSMANIHRGIAESYKAEINIKEQIINLHIDNENELRDQVKVYKRRSVIVMVVSGVLVGMVTLIVVK